MRIILALFAGAVAWMAVVASQSHMVGAAGHSRGLHRQVQPPMPGHYNRLASYYRIHLN
ncbi:MAG TPA: hypothetical protein VF306_19630 [Pirellulales bacterium]